MVDVVAYSGREIFVRGGVRCRPTLEVPELYSLMCDLAALLQAEAFHHFDVLKKLLYHLILRISPKEAPAVQIRPPIKVSEKHQCPAWVEEFYLPEVKLDGLPIKEQLVNPLDYGHQFLSLLLAQHADRLRDNNSHSSSLAVFAKNQCTQPTLGIKASLD
ncbi:hypothetical protein MC81_03595 [Achromobacter insolitus]|nr:hypothetical protein MC81_03595 [Achromobacter insolitus]